MRQRRTIPAIEKEKIVAEYLMGYTTYRELGVKYGYSFRNVNSWVNKFRGTPLKKSKQITPTTSSSKLEQLPTDVKKLQEELRMAKLHNELLNAIIDIAEDQLKIDIRKKSGTKR
jgi:transposase-like protein